MVESSEPTTDVSFAHEPISGTNRSNGVMRGGSGNSFMDSFGVSMNNQ